MKLFYILLVGGIILLLMVVWFNSKPLDVYPPDNYDGEGEVVFIPSSDAMYAPGWLISFKDFSLSDEFKHSYEFSGLPYVENLKSFTPYLHIPFSADHGALSNASLKMTLYEGDELRSTYQGQLKDWYCTVPYVGTNYTSDDKNYYSVDISILANSPSVYRLEVEYKPVEQVDDDEMGNIFLIMQGGK